MRSLGIAGNEGRRLLRLVEGFAGSVEICVSLLDLFLGGATLLPLDAGPDATGEAQERAHKARDGSLGQQLRVDDSAYQAHSSTHAQIPITAPDTAPDQRLLARR